MLFSKTPSVHINDNYNHSLPMAGAVFPHQQLLRARHPHRTTAPENAASATGRKQQPGSLQWQQGQETHRTPQNQRRFCWHIQISRSEGAHTPACVCTGARTRIYTQASTRVSVPGQAISRSWLQRAVSRPAGRAPLGAAMFPPAPEGPQRTREPPRAARRGGGGAAQAQGRGMAVT